LLPIAHILVVDDTSAVREVLKDYLEELDYHVDVAPDGYRALEMVDRCRPDLVLLDLSMPGLHGEDVLACLRLREPDLPVVVLSGNADVSVGRYLLARGAFDYIPKPIHFDYLEQVIAAALVQVAAA